MKNELSAMEIAVKSAEAMGALDKASAHLGITLDDVGPGTARMSMRVEDHHCNGHGICHGGFTFTLADSTFAFACNSYNRVAVAQHNTITYHAPGRTGDVLTATGREVALIGRSGLYDVEVRNQDGLLIASFRGASRIVRGEHFPAA